jgi:PTS system mannose-specific IIA component
MKGILLISHNGLAEAMLETAKMIYGDADKQIKTIGLKVGESQESFDKRIDAVIKELDTGEGVIALVDLLGGTPCNRLAKFVGDNLTILTGMNLGMVLETIVARDNEGLNINLLLDSSRESIVHYNMLLDTDIEDEII